MLVPIARRAPDRGAAVLARPRSLSRPARRTRPRRGARADPARPRPKRRAPKSRAASSRSPAMRRAPDRRRPPGVRRARAVAFAAVLSVPLVSWGLYAALGSPDMPSQPLAARLAADPAEAAGRRADCARRGASCRQFPDDGRGWDVLAPVYLRHGPFRRFGRGLPQGDPAARRDRGPRIRAWRSDRRRCRRAGHAPMRRRRSSARSKLEPGIRNRASSWPARWRRQGRIERRSRPGRRCAPACRPDSPWLAAIDQALAEANSRMAADAGASAGRARRRRDRRRRRRCRPRIAMR